MFDRIVSSSALFFLLYTVAILILLFMLFCTALMFAFSYDILK